VGIANSPVSVSGCRRARTSHPCLDWPSIVQDTCGEVGISGVGGWIRCEAVSMGVVYILKAGYPSMKPKQ
jgi:hypothetical protein